MPHTKSHTKSQIFHTLFQWLYERKPLSCCSEEGLLELCKLWALAGELDIWKTQNTILRLGMALMQPQEFVCGVETARWVYENTAPGSQLRDFVVTIFCQRETPVTFSHFARWNEKLGIFRDASAFLRILSRVRAGNPKGVDGYDLAKEFPLEYSYTAAKDVVGLGRVK